MANSTVQANNVVTNWLEKANKEYVREGKFGRYTGSTPNAIIQSNKNLQKLSIPLVGKLKGNGVTGSSTLSGNEDPLSNYAFVGTPTHYRNAVRVTDEENEKANIDLFKEAKDALGPWVMELKRDQMIQAFGAVEASGTYVNYGTATAGNLDTWNAANTDRILYGSAKSNLSSGDHTTSLATIDTTNDRLKTGTVSLLKRMAMNSSPLIRPVMLNADEPAYVFFVDSYGFRDLREDSAMQQANREAQARGKDNPLFTGGDLLWDSTVIVEVPDIGKFIDGDSTGSAYDGVWGANSTADSLLTGGSGSTRVGMGFFCGAQALAFIRGKDLQYTRDNNDDYQFNKGVGVAVKHDIRKLFYNAKQHGMITSFYSAPVDA